jgi:hypothetical protein
VFDAVSVWSSVAAPLIVTMPLGASLTFTPVYGWFTEGFDTVDLKEAKKLLDELT